MERDKAEPEKKRAEKIRVCRGKKKKKSGPMENYLIDRKAENSGQEVMILFGGHGDRYDPDLPSCSSSSRHRMAQRGGGRDRAE